MSEAHEAPVVQEAFWMRALRMAGVPLVSVLLAAVIGPIIIAATGKDPVLAFSAPEARGA